MLMKLLSDHENHSLYNMKIRKILLSFLLQLKSIIISINGVSFLK